MVTFFFPSFLVKKKINKYHIRKLRDVEETQRNTLLTCMINFLNDQIPIGVYIPLGLSSNLHHIVV